MSNPSAATATSQPLGTVPGKRTSAAVPTRLVAPMLADPPRRLIELARKLGVQEPGRTHCIVRGVAIDKPKTPEHAHHVDVRLDIDLPLLPSEPTEVVPEYARAIDAIPAPTPWISCSVFSTSAGDLPLQMAAASPPNRPVTSLAASSNVLAPPYLGRTGRLFSNPTSSVSLLDANSAGSRRPWRWISVGIRHALAHGMPRSKATAIRNAKEFSRMSLRVSGSSSFQPTPVRVRPYALSRSTTAFSSIGGAGSTISYFGRRSRAREVTSLVRSGDESTDPG